MLLPPVPEPPGPGVGGGLSVLSPCLHLAHGSLTDFGTVTAAILDVLALSPRGALELVTLNQSALAGTFLGAACGNPGLACLHKPHGGYRQ